MTTTIQIPKTVGAAQEQLTELGAIATATDWHRAAIVATFVDPGAANGRPSRNLPVLEGLESAASFARRGVVGLASPTTVLTYAQAWLARFERPTPGQRVELPTDPWPPTRTGTDGHNSPEGAAKKLDDIIRRHGIGVVAEAVTRASQDRLEAMRPAEVDGYEDVAVDTSGAMIGRRVDVLRTLSRMTDDARHVASLLADMEPDERGAYVDHVARVQGQVAMMAAFVAGVDEAELNRVANGGMA